MVPFPCSSLLPAMVASACLFAAPSGADPCNLKLPLEVRELVKVKFPGYRLVKVSDYLKEDVDQQKKDHKGDPCIGVTSTDMDGDGFPDFAFFITNKAGHTLLLAARNPGGKFWLIEKVSDFGKDGPGRSYVEPLKTGRYTDMFDTDDGPSEYTPEPGRVRSFIARNPGIIAGTIESSGVGFFFNGKRWVHLWLSD
jgi:hypothetical protein